jgi:DNA-binding NarL/FixJ family response regulator
MSIEPATMGHEDEISSRDDARLTDKLTVREHEVIRYLASGATAREIGAQLHISPRTVESHIFNAYRKLGVHSRVQLVRLLLERDRLGDEPDAR